MCHRSQFSESWILNSRTLPKKLSNVSRYSTKCRGKRDTARNSPYSISFFLLHFVLYLGKSIAFVTVNRLILPTPRAVILFTNAVMWLRAVVRSSFSSHYVVRASEIKYTFIVLFDCLQVAEALPGPAGHPAAQLQLRPGGEGDAGAAGQPAVRHHPPRIHHESADPATAPLLPPGFLRGWCLPRQILTQYQVRFLYANDIRSLFSRETIFYSPFSSHVCTKH